MLRTGDYFMVGVWDELHAFEYSKLACNAANAGGCCWIGVQVTNRGAVAGDEVVQLYLQDEVSSVTTPVRSLKGFDRVHLAPEVKNGELAACEGFSDSESAYEMGCRAGRVPCDGRGKQFGYPPASNISYRQETVRRGFTDYPSGKSVITATHSPYSHLVLTGAANK